MSPRLESSDVHVRASMLCCFHSLNFSTQTPAQFTDRADSVRALRAISVNRREDIDYKIPHQRRKEL